MSRIGEHAVVVGGSMGGLLAAAALSESYEQVTVLDRDALPEGAVVRKAVPQGRHAHSLLPGGSNAIEALLPGISAEMMAAGAPAYRAMEQVRLVLGGHCFARKDMGRESLAASRPFVEAHVRRRVRALPNVRVRDRVDVTGLHATADGRVNGVRLLHGAEETLPADLVVAATGRAARLGGWLESIGAQRPAEDRMAVEIHYATRYLRRRPGALGGDRIVLVGATPQRPRVLIMLAQEDERWVLMVGGYGAENRPPSDPAGLEAYTASVAPDDVLAEIHASEQLGDVATYGYPFGIRRRYERLRHFPDGLLVTGDAVCSFNPIYGQGMSVAAREAVALRACLDRGSRDLARRFFKAITPIVDDPWTLATGADLSLPVVAGERSRRVRAVNAYVRRLQAVAAEDADVAAAFSAVIGLVERPAHIMRPAIARRVLMGGRRAPAVAGAPRPAEV